MADEIVIETTSAEVIEVGVPGPQGPAGAAGAGLATLTTAGDLLYRNNSEATRLPIGSNGQVLKVSGGLPAWANESGAVTSVNGATGAVTVAAAQHATEHEAGEADEIQAMAALVATDDASLNGIYVPNASGTTSGGRLTLYKTGTRQNTKLEYNQSLSIWRLIKNAVVQLSGQQANATYAWTTQQWLDERSPQVLPNGGTVTRAGLEVLARRAADGTSNVATATTSEDGLLSSADKTKLNGIAANATANTASSATPSALGTASAGSATDYARADHTHSAEVSDSAFRVLGSTDATKKVAIEVDTNVPANSTVTLTAPSASGTLALAGAAPAAHAASHASAGSDPLFDQDLNTTDTPTFVSVNTANGDLVLGQISGGNGIEGFGRKIDFENPLIDGFGINIDDSTATIFNNGDNTKIANFDASGITTGTTRTFEFPDASGTLALVGDAPASHAHGNLTNDGKIGSTAGLPVVTTTAGAVTTLALGTANQVLRVNSGATGVEFADPAASGVTGAASSASDVLGVSGANITGVDANADRIIFWDDSASALKHLTVGSGLSLTDTTLTATGGGVTTGSVDNAVLRADGTGGSTSQSSDINIEDATTSTANNVTISNQHSGQTNSSLVLTPKGTGAIIIGPKPDGTSTGGNARGTRAVDLQPTRDSAGRIASGTNSFCIGHSNLASGTRSFAGGTSCTASGESSFAFGDNSSCSSPYGGIASGDGCSSTGAGPSHAFGFSCASTGNYAFSCGFDNTASGSNGSFACGQYAVANRSALFAYASGRFAADGDAQTIRYVLRGTTTTNAEVELLATTENVRLTIASGRVMFMNVMIVGVANGGGTVATFQRQYAIKNIGGTTSEIYAPVTIGTDSAASTSIALSANDTNDAVKVAATGLAATTIRWVAYVSAVEVAHG